MAARPRCRVFRRALSRPRFFFGGGGATTCTFSRPPSAP